MVFSKAKQQHRAVGGMCSLLSFRLKGKAALLIIRERDFMPLFPTESVIVLPWMLFPAQ